MLYTCNNCRKKYVQRFPYLIFTILLLLLLPATVLHAQRINRSNYQLLWRINGPGISAPSYLFGTMHLTDKRVFEFSDSVLIALRNAHSFALEVNLDSTVEYMYSPQGIMSDTVNYMRRILTAKEYRYVDSVLIQKTGTSIDQLKVKRFWVLETLLLDEEEALSQKAGRNLKAENIFLDGWLYQKAMQLNKHIHSLEKMQNQLHLVSSEVSEIQKEEFLENLGYYESENNSTVKPGTIYKQRISILDSFVNMYYEANLQNIASLITGTDKIEGPGLIERNIEMADNLARLVNEGSVFAAVGVAHLPGEKGMISLLRSKGFTVTPVKATFTGLAKKDRQQLDSIQGYMLNKIVDGYSVALPGMPVSYPVPNSNRKMYVGNSEGQTAFAFCMDLPQLGTDNQHLTNTIINNMAAQGNAVLQKSYPIVYRGTEGMEAYMTQNNIPFYIRVFIRNHRVFVFMYGTESKDSTGRKDFFKSVRFYDIVRPAITYDTVYRPQLGFSAILPSDINHIVNTATTRPVEVYSGIDDVRGVSYVVRIDKMQEGYFNTDDQALLSGIRMTLIKEDSTVKVVDSTVVVQDGLRRYELVFRHASGYISRFHFIPRGNLAYSLVSVYDSNRTDSLYWQRFLNGFHLLPLQAQTLNIRFVPADSSFSVMVPAMLKSIASHQQQESAPVRTYSYAAVDTLSYTTYTAEVYKYNRYHHDDPDSLAEAFIHPKDSMFIMISQQKSLLQGYPAYTIETKLRNTGLRCYRKLIIAGHTVYHLSTTCPEELASNGYSMQFLDSFKPGQKDKADTFRLGQKKLPMLLNDLQSNDTTVFKQAADYLQHIKPDSSDRKPIIDALTKSFPADTINRSARLDLLLTLEALPDQDVVFAAERLFSEAKDTKQRIQVLRFLTRLSLDTAIRAFLRLAPEIPDDYVPELSIFSYQFSEDSLYQQFMPDMVSTAEVSRSFLQAFTQYTCWDSTWLPQQRTRYGLNRLLPAINLLFEFQLSERTKYKSDDAKRRVWENRLVSTGHILAQQEIPANATTVAIFRQLLTDSVMSIRTLAVQGLLRHGIPVNDKIIREILDAPNEGYDFITTMESAQQLPKIRHLLTQELIGRSYLNYYFSDEYAVTAVEQLSRVKVQTGKEPAVWLILYRIKTEGSDDWVYVLNGPHPLNNKELNLEPILIHIINDDVRRKDKKLLAEEALNAYKSFLEPEETEESY